MEPVSPIAGNKIPVMYTAIDKKVLLEIKDTTIRSKDVLDIQKIKFSTCSTPTHLTKVKDIFETDDDEPLKYPRIVNERIDKSALFLRKILFTRN